MKITIPKDKQDQRCQEMPRGIDPVEWAQYNARQNRRLAALSGLPEPSCLPPPERETAIEIRVEITGPIGDLLRSVRRAADDLEGHSPLGDRVSLQLLTALARFHAEVEHP